MTNLSPYLPPSSGEANAIVSLLQVIANPAEAKKALERMVEERKAIDNATIKQQEQFKIQSEALQKERIENDALRRRTDTIASKAASEMGEAKARLAMVDQRMSNIDGMERRLVEERVKLEERDAKLKQQEDEMVNRWHALQAREASVERQAQGLVKREEDLAMREKTLADDIAENTRWLAGLKPPRTR